MCVPSVHTIHNIYKTLFYRILVLPLRFFRIISRSFCFSFALFRNRFALFSHCDFRCRRFCTGAAASICQRHFSIFLFAKQYKNRIYLRTIQFAAICCNLRPSATCAHLQPAPSCDPYTLQPYMLISPLRFWVISPFIIFFG